MRKKSTNGFNEAKKSGRQTPYQRVNQKEGSPNYVFLYSEDDQSEDEEIFPLKTRNISRKLPRKVEVIKVEIQSEDTLQALALRYGCNIAELKRINNIHKDNEIHAHQFIKVPVQPYSLLTETINQTSESGDTTTGKPKENVCQAHLVNLMPAPTPSTSSLVEINSIIFNSTLEPSSEVCDTPFVVEETETDHLISSSHNDTTAKSAIVNTFKCSGADWGLSWFQLLCFFLILGVFVPIIYLVYIAEKPKPHGSSELKHKLGGVTVSSRSIRI
ncbi:hypothetical protein QAD02_004989 [Eretmocerus hayati]|uniref:Uncharacterized protein n=1 Tax=Eretmocerus hayati TaxID=131215 RepID=A0ACC2NRM2_9HYME|nr:hypothetical protein QAD02_004989 [Eretmocerus hayati]